MSVRNGDGVVEIKIQNNNDQAGQGRGKGAGRSGADPEYGAVARREVPGEACDLDNRYCR